MCAAASMTREQRVFAAALILRAIDVLPNAPPGDFASAFTALIDHEPQMPNHYK